MPNQYSKLTAENINVKLNRKRNPVRSMTQLAREFGVRTTYQRSNGSIGSAAPGAFRQKVLQLVGPDGYKTIVNR